MPSVSSCSPAPSPRAPLSYRSVQEIGFSEIGPQHRQSALWTHSAPADQMDGLKPLPLIPRDERKANSPLGANVATPPSSSPRVCLSDQFPPGTCRRPKWTMLLPPRRLHRRLSGYTKSAELHTCSSKDRQDSSYPRPCSTGSTVSFVTSLVSQIERRL